MASAMAMSISTLTSSFSSLSFSSQISQKPFFLALAPVSNSSKFSKTKTLRLTVVASSAAAAVDEPLTDESETINLVKYVKSRLLGGFAAQRVWGTGRRKSAVARVVLKEGTGKVIINYRDAEDYLQGNPYWLQYLKEPLVTMGYENSYDVFVKAHGGGLSGQAQAIALGIARALVREAPIHKPPLKKAGHLTRDSRVVERKKVGLKKARKAPQFSKR